MTNSKRVIMIRNADAHDFGGGERYSTNNAQVLEPLGWQTILISRNAKLLHHAQENNIATLKGWWLPYQNWGGWRIVLLPIYFGWQVFLILWYIGVLLRLNPQVVHIQSRDDFIAATLAARLLRKRVVWTDHADLKYVYVNYATWYKNFVGKMVFWCSLLAHHVTLVSKSESELVAQSLGRSCPKNYSVIYNGVPLEPEFVTHTKKRTSKSVIFSCTSRLVTTKGIGELIDAFMRVQNLYPQCSLELYGEGTEEAQFKKQAAKNSHIIFKGFPDDTLIRVAATDVFVHPSYHEGFSISLVEATKLGLPIIACAVGGNVEIVRDNENGLLVPAKDSAALADAMITLIENRSKRLQFANASRKTYLDNFVLEEIIKKQLLPLYE